MTTNVTPRVWPEKGAEWVGGRDQPEWELEFSPEMQPLGILWIVFVFYLTEKNICRMCCAGLWLGFYNSRCRLYRLFKSYVKSSITFPEVPISYGSGRADVTLGPAAPRCRVAAV